MDAATLYATSRYPVRTDLGVAHDAWLAHVASPGTWWTARQRTAFVAAVWDALDDTDPLPPWVPPSTVEERVPSEWPLPIAAFDMAYRLARHAATATEAWYERTVADLGAPPEAYVELAALAATGAAVGAFGPALGLGRPTWPPPVDGAPDGSRPPVRAATLNWVPVAGEPDATAAVVQAFSAVPHEWDALWRLAEVQYMSDAEMMHLDWRRPGSPLHRRQLELVAARLSLHRQCFF